MDQGAGETEEKLRPSVETRGIHRCADGRPPSRTHRLGQNQREKGLSFFFSMSNQHMFVHVFCLLGTPVSPHGCFSVVHLLFFPQPLSMFDIQFLNAVGDLLDLIPALAPSPSRLLRLKHPGMGHCSALIKVGGQNTLQPGRKTH